MSQKRLIALKTTAQMGLHMGACRISITFDNRIDNTTVFFLKVEIIIFWACARSLALQISSRDDARSDQLQKFREAPVLGRFRYCKMQLKISVSGRGSILQTLANRSMSIEDFLDLHRRTAQCRKSRRLDFENGSQFQKFNDRRDTLCGEIVERPLRSLLRSQSENAGAFSRLDETVGTQDGNGFPHDRPAYGILPGQCAFAW